MSFDESQVSSEDCCTISADSQHSYILSKELKVDKELKFSAEREKIKKIIADSVPAIKTLKDKLNSLKKIFLKNISFPNNYVLATLANGLYKGYKELYVGKDGKDLHGKEVYPKEARNWKLLAVAYDSGPGSERITVDTVSILVSNAIAGGSADNPNGYCGAAYWNSDTQQVVIAHCGTKNKGGVYADIYGVFLNQHVSQIDSAVTFTDVITSVLTEINVEKGSNIQLFITGHSLGAWLASITVFSAKYLKRMGDTFISNSDFEKSGYHSSAVIFDGPGCEEMLRRIQSIMMNRNSPSFITSLDITNYLSAPNLVNACNLQVGDVYRLFIPLTEENKKHLQNLRQQGILQALINCARKYSIEMHIVAYTCIMHNMESLKRVFCDKTGEVLSDNGELRIQKVIDWPLLISSDKKEEGRSKLVHAGTKVLEVFGTLTTEVFGIISDANLILRALNGLVFKGVEAVYESYKYTIWYKDLMRELDKFLKLANETNNFQPDKSDINLASAGREMRYETKQLDSSYKNEHCLNVFKLQERRFLEMYKYLENYEFYLQGIITLDKLFQFLNEDEMLLRDVLKILKCCKVEKGRIYSKSLPECVICIKRVLHLFPDIWEKVDYAYQNLPFEIHKNIYQLISTSYLNSSKKILDFKGDTLGLKTFLQNKNKVILHSVNIYTSLGSVRAYNTFNIVKKVYEGNYHIFLSLDRIFSLGVEIFISFFKKINSKCLLFIECDCSLDFTVEGLLDSLFKILQGNNNDKNHHLKVVLITEKGSTLAEFVSRYFENNELYQKEEREVTFDDLTVEAQNKLMQTTVLFQGINVPFIKVVNGCRTLSSVIDEETVVELFRNKSSIEIGNRVPSLNNSENYYYVDRQVVQNIKVEEKIFTDEELNDLFAVSNCSKEQLSHLTMGKKVRDFRETDPDTCNPIQFIILDKSCDENSFTCLCEEYLNHNIHWFEMNDYGLIYKKSRANNLCGLRQYINNNEDDLQENEYSLKNPFVKIVNFNCVENFEDKIIIIAAQPGMGKSTALTHLVNQRVDDSQWLVPINLVEYRNKLKKIEFNNISDIVEFFCDKNSVNELTRKLFLCRLTEAGNIVFLLDGFDEITSEGRNNVINLLRLLRNTRVEKVFISTRLHLRSALENSLSTLAYTFKPFFQDDQENFLRKLWENEVDPKIDKDLFKNFIKNFLQYITASLGDKERKFMRMPLQMWMVAQVFQANVQNKVRFDSSENIFRESFNVLKMYDCFIRLKYEVYFGNWEKLGATNIDPDGDLEENPLFKTFNKIHRIAAFKTLFPEYEKTVLRGKSLSKADKQMLNMIGIAQIINDNIVFIHRTFAEYFVADFLTRRFRKSKNCEKYKLTFDFLSQEYFQDNILETEAFLDYFAKQTTETFSEFIFWILNKGTTGKAECCSRENPCFDKFKIFLNPLRLILYHHCVVEILPI